MLVHQLRRLNSPAAFVTAKDAQFWPLLLRGENTTDEERAQEGMFDRVLCDVPCSGDGTARKNPGIWKHWTASSSHSIHPLQVSIALNGARLTKVGGYVCYSTCSINPIENEAVVAEILRSADGSLELVDKRPDLPGMVARPGWSHWKVIGEAHSRKAMKDKAKKNNARMRKKRKEWEDKQKREEEQKNDTGTGDANAMDVDDDKKDEENKEAEEDVVEEVWEPVPPSWDEETLQKRAVSRGLIEYKSLDDVPSASTHHIRASCFPPTPEEAEKFKLERCLRCLPHDLDTGGFFVALLKKVAPMSSRSRKKADELANAVASKMDHTFSKKDKEEKNATEQEVEKVQEEADLKSEESGANDMKDSSSKKKISFGFNNNDSFIAADEDAITPLIEFYGCTDQLDKGQFMARAGGNSKLLYFITKSVKENLIDRGVQDRMQVINSGLRAFERRNKVGKADCDVR